MGAKITSTQMAEAVIRSGYLLEQRVFPIIEKAGYYVETNPAFPDPVTGKSREYDFSAISGINIYQEDWEFLWIHLIGECINNSQPIVFFSSEKITHFLFHEDLKCSGIPLKFTSHENGDEEISFNDFFNLDKFHHYCRGPYSTQYCSFQQKSGKSEWLACHNDEHHNLFDTLVTATEYEMNDLFSSWEPPRKGEKEPLDLNLFYPILIIKNNLYECEQKKNNPIFNPRNHIQFRKSIVSKQEQKTFHIDIITESYLNRYLDMLEKEHEKLATCLKQQKKEVRLAIDKIVSQARAAKHNRKWMGFRDILEF